MYSDVLNYEIAATKFLQAEKYERSDPEMAKMLRGQAAYFESLAAAESVRRSEYDISALRDEILAAVDEKMRGWTESNQAALAQWERHPVQARLSVGSNPTGGTSLPSRVKEAWGILRAKPEE